MLHSIYYIQCNTFNILLYLLFALCKLTYWLSYPKSRDAIASKKQLIFYIMMRELYPRTWSSTKQPSPTKKINKDTQVGGLLLIPKEATKLYCPFWLHPSNVSIFIDHILYPSSFYKVNNNALPQQILHVSRSVEFPKCPRV